MQLTPHAVEDFRPVDKPVKLYDGRGLFLLVSPGGAKWWRLKYRFAGREKQISLGVYPDVDLEEARARRDAARDLLADGIDPSEHRKTQHALELAEQARQIAATRFTLDSDGALSFRLGNRQLLLTPAETTELRDFLDATRAVTPKVTHAAD